MSSNTTYPTPQSDSKTEEPIAGKLERISSAIVTAINARDFTFSSPSAQELLAHIDPQWKAHCSDGLYEHGGHGTLGRCTSCDERAWVAQDCWAMVVLLYCWYERQSWEYWWHWVK